MMNKRWVVVISLAVVLALFGSVAAGLISSSSSGPSAPASTTGSGELPTTGPTPKELEQLASDLSSGDDAVILAAIADLPPGSEQAALKSLGSLSAVVFDPNTLRFDEATGAAVVDARLTDSTGSTRREREVLVKRDGRWLLYSSLVPATATGSPVQ